ncbi:MAG: 4-hydroxythreonine-4-phosphate dehydrogenase PdxA [Thiomargarita sp.]|nr:4-hydroxythreonine-4-phosphate dehydrogenase PdxA [Thiomargarita sp.]
MTKPIIGITIGDPASIGPEIVIKALQHPDLYKICNPLVIGDKKLITAVLKTVDSKLNINIIENPIEGNYEIGSLDLIDLHNVTTLQTGIVTPEYGQACYEYIVKGFELAISKQIQALATAPINKNALRAANINHIGHTEILASLCKVDDPLTMFEVRNMRVFFLSRHVSLRQACNMVTKERVLDYIIRCSAVLKRIGIVEGTMAVAGLNPHSGEQGLLGDEEITGVEPAIKAAQAQGYNVVGPIGADSVFFQTLQGKYNSVLSLYHDQGHIATKTLDFNRTVAITNDLPFLRTSVDHGTAFDIAGKNLADETNMLEAIKLAAKYHF